MKLDEIVAWYQKKIGTYDKQEWEKTVEQKILDGFSSSVTLKTAKLKTELIDVDLVRGSTFPKAKPKQTLLTVVRLAIQRYFLLPVYAKWWVKQTSHNTFALLFTLYMLQMLNWAIYTYNTNRDLKSVVTNGMNATTIDVGSSEGENAEEHVVFISDLLIPMVLSLLLSLIHSQIVATNIATGVKAKRRRFSNTNISAGGAGGGGGVHNSKLAREMRPRRRKKLVKLRCQELSEQQNQQQRKILNSQSLSQKTFSNADETASLTSNNPNAESETTNHSKYSSLLHTINTSNIHAAINEHSNTSSLPPNRLMTLDLKHTACSTDVDTSTFNDCLARNLVNNQQVSNKKRNVNWHSPIHNYAIETQEKQQQTSPQTTGTNTTTTTATSSSETSTPNQANNNRTQSSNSSGSSSNASENNSPTKIVRIDETVQEFYDELVSLAVEPQSPTSPPSPPPPLNQPAQPAVDAAHHAQPPRAGVGDDDGFESLNGKSSSGEETNASIFPTPPMPASSSLPTTTTTSTLRLRLNANRADELPATNASTYRRKVPLSSESDAADKNAAGRRSLNVDATQQQQTKKLRCLDDDYTTDHSDDDVEDVETVSSPASAGGNNSNYNECTTSATEWLGVTTNSEECSYSSELDNSDDYNKNQQYSDEDGFEMDFAPATILNPHSSSDRISCTVWEQRDIKKAQMSVLEISSCIIERVESMSETNDYIIMGVVFSLLLSFVPTFCRLCEVTIDSDKNELSYWDLPMLLWEKSSFSLFTLFHFAFGQTNWERTVLIISLIQRFCLTMMLFMIFAVAERTFKQRFIYAKLFSHLTSSRRARKSNLPHFRLNKVRNIKTWLSVRSYLKKRGPQRSVDVIVSAAFIITHLLLAFLSVEWLKDSVHLHSHLNLEALMWSSTVGIFLLRFMTLGNKIHHKYRSISVLITEQINLYLQIEQKPKKKDELMVSNSVLKLAADLLKELETPFKVSGLRANPYLFTTIKVVILSALSGVLSEMLGFKLKLLKIKIK